VKGLVTIGVVGALALGACSSGSTSAAKAKPLVEKTTTTTKPPPVAPLTGLADPTGVAQTRSLVSIKIDNDSSLSRPQTGIDQADIVWDEVVEGEATRFLAMFQSPARNSVIVAARETTVRNGPFDESPSAFTANDGAELRLLDRKDDWLQVTDGTRRIGWVKRDAVIYAPQP